MSQRILFVPGTPGHGAWTLPQRHLPETSPRLRLGQLGQAFRVCGTGATTMEYGEAREFDPDWILVCLDKRCAALSGHFFGSSCLW